MLGKIELFGPEMLFYTFDDFMKKRHELRENLATKDSNYVILYRMYIESRPWVKEYYRGVIWDYLNFDMTEEMLVDEFMKYRAKYGDKHA